MKKNLVLIDIGEEVDENIAKNDTISMLTEASKNFQDVVSASQIES